MGTQENGLTLQDLAQRLEGLQRENAERLQTLERENDELRSKVATLEGSGTRRGELAEKRGSDTRRDGKAVSEYKGQVSRRSLLSKAGAAAVAAVAAGTLLNSREAKASHGNPGITVESVDTHFVFSQAAGGNAIFAENNTGDLGAVEGSNLGSGAGVRAKGGTGVWGISSSTGHSGVFGQHTGSSGYGVLGDGTGSDGAGVLGRNSHGYGVKGEGLTGVWGLSSHAGFAANYGQNTNAGWGVVGDGKGAAFSGVMGRSDSGSGVRGESTSGYGGRFEGGKAQLMLKPGGSAGKPTTGTHTKGEIYMDKAGALFVCTAGDGTTLGTWKKVTMKLV